MTKLSTLTCLLSKMKQLTAAKPLSLLVAVCVLALSANNLHATENEALNKLTSGTHFAIMRHAIAPGNGDPSNFNVENCSTQRNLSQQGIDQAVTIGKRLRESGITDAQVFTSQWCRCIDTATQLNIGEPAELPIINSFYQDQAFGPSQTQALEDWLGKQDLSKPLMLVTHQVNITGLINVFPASGEVIIIQRNNDGTLSVTDRVRTD